MTYRLRCSAACGIFPDQGLNPCLLHWEVDSSPLSHQGSPTLCFSQVYSLGTQYFYILQKGHHFYSLIITCRPLVVFEIPEPVVSVINFGKFSVIISFNVSSFLSLFSFWYSLYTYIGEGNGNPLQSSCLENSMDGGACWATVHGVAESWTRLRLHFTYTDIRYSLRNCPTVLTHSDLFHSLSLLHFSFRCFYWISSGLLILPVAL